MSQSWAEYAQDRYWDEHEDELIAQREEEEAAARNPQPVRALHDNPVAVVLREGSIEGRRLA